MHAFARTLAEVRLGEPYQCPFYGWICRREACESPDEWRATFAKISHIQKAYFLTIVAVALVGRGESGPSTMNGISFVEMVLL